MRLVTKMMVWGATVVLLSLGLLGGFFYPILKTPLTLSILIYWAVLIQYRHFWLFFIPLLLPLLNLAPWSGFVLYEEFDLFLAATLSTGILRGEYSLASLKKIKPGIWGVGCIMAASVFISLIKGLTPFSTVTANDFSNYVSPFNGIRVARSFIWAVLLLPMLNADVGSGNKRAGKYLVYGFTASLIGVFIIILWERGVFWDLFNATYKYGYLKNFLDFSSLYRTTALFSEMNTGGSAIDGYIALSWIFSAGLFLESVRRLGQGRLDIKRLAPTLLSGSALFSSLYVIGTTFTRITYLSFGVSSVLFCLGILIGNRNSKSRQSIGFELWSLFFLAAFVSFFFISYNKGGGFIGLFSVLCTILGGLFVGRLIHFFPAAVSGVAGLTLFCQGNYGLIHAMTTSKWNPIQFWESVMISFMIIWGAFSLSIGLGRLAWIKRKTVFLIGIFIPVVFVFAASVPMVSGNRMAIRFSDSERDAGFRFTHWKDALVAMDRNWDTIIRGMGVGTFPKTFIKRNEKAQRLGTFQFVDERERFLRLRGGRDMAVGQRLSPSALSSEGYTLKFRARTNTPAAKLPMGICSQNFLKTEDCVFFRVDFDSKINQWNEFELSVEEKELNNYKWYTNWPRRFSFHNLKKGVLIDVDDVRLYGSGDENLIFNGDFENGGQRWFSYNEHEHLPWHTKNILLHFYYEQGVLGVIGFVIFLVSAFSGTLPGIIKGRLFPLTIGVALAGITVVGITGSLIDSPRVAFLYYLIGFIAMIPNEN